MASETKRVNGKRVDPRKCIGYLDDNGRRVHSSQCCLLTDDESMRAFIESLTRPTRSVKPSQRYI